MEGVCVCMYTYVCMCVSVYTCVKFYRNKQNNPVFSSVTVPSKLFWRPYSFCAMWVTFQLLYFVYGDLFTWLHRIFFKKKPWLLLGIKTSLLKFIFFFSDRDPTQGFALANECSCTRILPVLNIYSWVITKHLTLTWFSSASLAAHGLEVLSEINGCLSLFLSLVPFSPQTLSNSFRVGSKRIPIKVQFLPVMVQGKWFWVWKIFPVLSSVLRVRGALHKPSLARWCFFSAYSFTAPQIVWIPSLSSSPRDDFVSGSFAKFLLG